MRCSKQCHGSLLPFSFGEPREINIELMNKLLDQYQRWCVYIYSKRVQVILA